MRRGGETQTGRRSRRLLAPLAGLALLAVAVAERLRRRRGEQTEGRKHVSEANKTVARRIVEEAFNEGRYEVIEELIAPTYVNHDPATGDVTGIDGVKQSIDGYRSAFPDLTITIKEQIAEGDLVATRWIATGTQKGELMGVAATGKEATVTGLTLDTIKDGKIVESWNNWDTLGMLQQLGVVPALTTA